MEYYCNPFLSFDIGFVLQSTYQVARDELSAEQQEHARTKAKCEDWNNQLEIIRTLCDKLRTELQVKSSQYQNEVEAA
jgi:hypothetical protein